jgi:hypothetical protein
MRRYMGAALVIAVLVGVPVAVAVVATSRPSQPAGPLSAQPFVGPTLAYTHSTADRCAWTHHHADLACMLKDGERCTVEIQRQTDVCLSTSVHVRGEDPLGYGAPAPSP